MKVDRAIVEKNFPGIVVFVISLAVYWHTASPTVSFWDCGEFISCAAFLQVPHPPGAPLYLILARLFTLFAGDVTTVAFCVNILSVLASASAVWLVYKILYLLLALSGTDQKQHEKLIMEAASMLGALLFAFTDTFWFSAVEAEVYALSLFFSALTLWVFLKWYSLPASSANGRWLFLGIYLVGLSLGVHLLNLLMVPAFVLLFGWKRWGYHLKVTLGSLAAGFLILALLYGGLVRNGLLLAGHLELFLVNDLGFFQHSGVLLWFVLLVGLLAWGIWYSHKRLPLLHFGLVAFALLFMGWSSYLLIPIRSAAGTPINMNSPDDVFALKNYINRKQYGDRPLLYGVHAWAQPNQWKQTYEWKFNRALGRYNPEPSGLEYSFPVGDFSWFPRIHSRDDQQTTAYQWWLEKSVDRDHPPKLSEEISFFLRYQMGHMYLRYLFWNFVGRQNDEPGYGDVFSGNWASGIKALDRYSLGSRQWPTPTELYSAARNPYFGVPFILALLGFSFLLQSQRRRRLLGVLSLLFILTGPAIVFYLNQPPLEPRERDYVFVGSFMVVALFAGIGIHGIFKSVRDSRLTLWLLMIVVALAGPGWLFSKNLDDHQRSKRYLARDLAFSQLRSCPVDAILFTYGDNDTYPLWYAQQVEGVRRDVRLVNLGLLNLPWYVRQQRYAVARSAGLHLTLSDNFYRNHGSALFQIVPVGGRIGGAVEQLNELESALAVVGANQSLIAGSLGDSFTVNLLGGDSVDFHTTHQYLSLGDLALIDLVASNASHRPVCFARNVEVWELGGWEAWLADRGLIRQLSSTVSGAEQSSEIEPLMALFMDSVSIGREEGVWWDHTCREALEASGYRDFSFRLAENLLQQDQMEKAALVLKKSLTEWPFSPFMAGDKTLELCALLARAHEFDLAASLLDAQFRISFQNLNYYYHSGYSLSEIQKRFCPMFSQIKNLAHLLGMEGLSGRIEQELNNLNGLGCNPPN